MKKERRTKEAYKLRIYIDAIKTVKAMSDDEWIRQWAVSDSQDRYRSRSEWLGVLEGWAIMEADNMLIKEAA